MPITVKEISEMFSKDVFTDKGYYCGKVSDVEFELEADRDIKIRGSVDDPDGDSIVFVGWYLNMDNPANITASKIASSDSIKREVGEGAISALEFKYKFKPGTYNLTLVVADAESEGTDKLSSQTIRIEVKKKSTSGPDVESNLLIGAVVAIIIIIVVLVILMMMFRKRKPVSEREQMYGKDMGLKPGEAYPVEDDKDGYFGDALDRKGVSSFESPPATGQLEGEQAPAVEGKTEQKQLPPKTE